MQVVNLFGDEWDGRRDRPGWQWKHASVSERAGAELFGASLYEIEPGERSFPYVWNNPVRAGLCERSEDWPWSGGPTDL